MVHASDTDPLPLDLIFSDADFFFRAGTEMYKISSPPQPSQILRNSSQASSRRSGRVERYSSQTRGICTVRQSHSSSRTKDDDICYASVWSADLAFCRKDETIAEASTHDELVARGGESAKLYGIQASAFVDI
ncbi:uncharacterized protein ARMOST_21381 [Armillaria ostoyae]|uniref:Uncharacterized protein n=1 Tax=Armillaria ostoyae TaxID=47428 RepID=A0A284SA18_ARMOS|nr:uncharacterized protein ARMOST_21381 [Armillaria ostoyae]